MIETMNAITWISAGLAAAGLACLGLLYVLLPVFAPTIEESPKVSIDSVDISDLRQLRNSGFRLREVMEADADRCCDILGIDPTAASEERDIAASIVLSGATVDDVIRQLERIRT